MRMGRCSAGAGVCSTDHIGRFDSEGNVLQTSCGSMGKYLMVLLYNLWALCYSALGTYHTYDVVGNIKIKSSGLKSMCSDDVLGDKLKLPIQ